MVVIFSLVCLLVDFYTDTNAQPKQYPTLWVKRLRLKSPRSPSQAVVVQTVKTTTMAATTATLLPPQQRWFQQKRNSNTNNAMHVHWDWHLKAKEPLNNAQLF